MKCLAFEAQLELTETKQRLEADSPARLGASPLGWPACLRGVN